MVESVILASGVDMALIVSNDPLLLRAEREELGRKATEAQLAQARVEVDCCRSSEVGGNRGVSS